MAKEKKISVTFNHMRTRNYIEFPNLIQCRVVYNRKSTNFNMRMINGGIRCSDEDYKKYYEGKSNWLDYFESWVKGIIRYEVKSDKDQFELGGLIRRIDGFYIKGIRYWALDTFVLMKVLLHIEDAISHKKYKQLEGNTMAKVHQSKNKNDWSFLAIDRLQYMVEELRMPISNLPENLVFEIDLLVNFILFDYQVSLEKLKRSDDYLYGFVNIGDWVGGTKYQEMFTEFIHNKKILLPEGAMYLHDFIKREFSMPKGSVEKYLEGYNTFVENCVDLGKEQILEEDKNHEIFQKVLEKERKRIESEWKEKIIRK